MTRRYSPTRELFAPYGHGHDLYEHLLLRPDESAARLIIMTGSLVREDDAFAAALGAHFLTKPCSIPALVTTLRITAFSRVSSPGALLAAA